MKRKIAAILAADVVSYSRLVSEDEEETLARLCSYRAVFSDFIERFRGRVFNTAGDAILAEFESAVDAVRCTVDIQETLKARNLAYPPSRQMKFRIGITIGDVVERDGDLLGDGVNIAARLESLAPEGGICISRSVYESAANKLSVEFSDKGKQNLKNIPEPVHAYTFASNVTPPKRATRGFPLQQLLLYGAGCGALLIVAGSLFVLLPRTKEESFSAIPVIRKAEGKVNVASTGPASSSHAEPSRPQASLTESANAGASKQASPDEVSSRKTPTPEAVSSSSEKTSVLLTPTDETQVPSLGTAENSDDPTPQPSQPSITDPLAMQANLKRQWNGCRAGAQLEQIVKSCSELIASNVYSGGELASVYLELGRAQRDNKHADEAIQSYTEAIRVAPSAKAYNDRGIVHYDRSEWNRAIDDYTEAIRLDHQYGEAFNNRAWTKVRAGRAALALEDANEAVRLLPSKAFAIDTRAHVYEALGNRDAAIRDYRKALELAPANKGSLQGLKRLGSAL